MKFTWFFLKISYEIILGEFLGLGISYSDLIITNGTQ